jgi:hypothetical protein
VVTGSLVLMICKGEAVVLEPMEKELVVDHWDLVSLS